MKSRLYRLALAFCYCVFVPTTFFGIALTSQLAIKLISGGPSEVEAWIGHLAGVGFEEGGSGIALRFVPLEEAYRAFLLTCALTLLLATLGSLGIRHFTRLIQGKKQTP